MRNTKKKYGGKTRKFYGGKTRKFYGGKFKLRRFLANTIGKVICPYPFVKYEGECMTQSALDKKKYNNRFDGLGYSYNYTDPTEGATIIPKSSKTKTKKGISRMSRMSRIAHYGTEIGTKIGTTFKTKQV
jgi:hypothetical protein